MQGDDNFKQDMASMKDKAQEQGTAQPELKSTAQVIKKVISLFQKRWGHSTLKALIS